jgi:hypothetical protein
MVSSQYPHFRHKSLAVVRQGSVLHHCMLNQNWVGLNKLGKEFYYILVFVYTAVSTNTTLKKSRLEPEKEAGVLNQIKTNDTWDAVAL